jgi:hypothetical protein
MIKSKFKGMDETGILGAFCARHGTPLCFIDMLAGERFCYPNRVLQEVMGFYSRSVTYLIYYDIACKYLPQLRRQDFAQGFKIIGAVPKFHVYAHGFKCLSIYHPTRIQGCGLTDGEVCERRWSNLGRYHSIVKEMLPFNRWETLEDGMLDIWWSSLFSIIKSFPVRIKKASRILAESEIDLQLATDEETREANELRAKRKDPSTSEVRRFSQNLSNQKKLEYFEHIIRTSVRHSRRLNQLRHTRLIPRMFRSTFCF